MANMIDLLMQADANKLATVTEKYEVKRLSKILGSKFVLTLGRIPAQRLTEIQRMAINFDKRGNVSDADIFGTQALTIIDGVKDPDLKDKKLLEKFGVVTPKELINKLFLAGEITDIAQEINKLNGYADADVEEIKN